jgi:hypothetical protein
MNVLLFIVTIFISFIIVRIGAIAFELTGLEWSLSKFQALSCFTGTGFTTRESELIVGHPQRRRIASVIMVLGNAGLVTLIATFANSLQPNIIVPKISVPFLHLVVPSGILPWVNLLIITASLFFTFKIFIKKKVRERITELLRRSIEKREIIKPVSFEDLIVATGGYGLASIDIDAGNATINKTIRKMDLTHKDLTILAILRRGEIMTNPPPTTKIREGDKLICYGKLDDLKREFEVASA